MARKAKRSKKQIAAARKNLRKARRARNPISAAAAAERIRKGSRKAKARGKKAAATRARRKAARSRAGKKGARARARKHGGAKRRSTKRRSTARKGHRKSRKRVLAGKRGAATRKLRRGVHGPLKPDGTFEPRAGERRRRRRKGKRKSNPLPLQANARRRRKRRRNPLPLTAAAPRRRRKKGRASPRKYKRGKKAGYSTRGKGKRYTKRRRANAARRGHDRRRGRKIRRNPVAASRRRRHRRHGRRRNPISVRRSNPISGIGEFLSGMFGVGTGFALASLFDRLVTNHNYITGGGGLMDAPAAGSIYNSEAILAPIWAKSAPSDMFPYRLGAAAVSVVVPLTVAAFLPRHPAAKAFFQLAGFGALGRFSGKLIEDGTAALFGTNQLVAKLYAPELAARSKMMNNALPAAPAATFAGALPKGLRRVGSAVQDDMGNAYVEVAAGQFRMAPPPPPPAVEPIRELPAHQNVAPQDARAFEAAAPVSKQFTEVPYNPLMTNPDGLARAFH